MKYFISIILLVVCCLSQIEAHGMMLSPVGRSSRWRYDTSAPTNYDDNGVYCGGFGKQTANGGLCGLCGDDYSMAQPRPNELGGKYGQGVIVESYTSSNTVTLTVRITANHLGYFKFHLCNLDAYGSESESCFKQYPLKFTDGSEKFGINSTTGDIKVDIKLPAGLSCKHCVLRWTYVAGNNWGVCDDGTGALGCGAQENFVNCADVSILSSTRSLFGAIDVEVPVEVEETA